MKLSALFSNCGLSWSLQKPSSSQWDMHFHSMEYIPSTQWHWVCPVSLWSTRPGWWSKTVPGLQVRVRLSNQPNTSFSPWPQRALTSSVVTDWGAEAMMSSILKSDFISIRVIVQGISLKKESTEYNMNLCGTCALWPMLLSTNWPRGYVNLNFLGKCISNNKQLYWGATSRGLTGLTSC